MGKVIVGTSGWSYDEWVRKIYPKKTTPKLSFYISHFDTAEVNSTFYTLPSRETIQGLIKYSPRNFKFSLKFPKEITHDYRLIGTKDKVEQFIELISPLKEYGKLGPLLIQLPPSFSTYYSQTLEDFVSNLPAGMDYAVEFRHKSWEAPDTVDLLKQYSVCNVVTDSPLQLQSELTTDWAYVRVHGWGKKIWFDYLYSEEEVQRLTDTVHDISDKTKFVYVYFNNHYGGNSVENALQMLEKMDMLGNRQAQLLKKIRSRVIGLDAFTR